MFMRTKVFVLNDIVDITYGNKFDLQNMTFNAPSINFISRTALNNGVSAKVDRICEVEPYPEGCLTVALGGSIGATFYQNTPFYTAQNIAVIQFKENIPFLSKLYLCQIIKFEVKNKFRAFGRELNRHIKADFSVQLPIDENGCPNWKFMETFIKSLKYKPITTKIKKINHTVDTKAWKSYSLDYLFDFVKGKRLTKADMIPGNVNFLGAISENNGIREKIAVSQYCEPNCITVNYNGSVGEAFYQKEPFWASDDVNVLYAKDFWSLNQYIAMFIITVIKANKYRFGYGRKWTLEKMKDTIIKLPSKKDGMPDFEYMEKYIKMLPYSDRI